MEITYETSPVKIVVLLLFVTTIIL